MRLILIYLFCFTAATSFTQTTTISYTESTDDFVNPERGFYRYSTTQDGLLDLNTLIGYRSLHSPFGGASYQVYSSLVFRYIVLSDFKNIPISMAFLNDLEQDFNTARAAGVKLIPRVAYVVTTDNSCCGGGDCICDPYGDVGKPQILAHIEQLKPLFQQHADVIATLQMGFIGIWGEQYYTDHFGDASQAGQGFLSDQNWTDRKEVLDSLLHALPERRMVQVRYPQMKQKYVYGNAATTDAISSPPLALQEAFDGSDKSRIAHHNDCFLASTDDFGTYFSYDQTPFSDTTNLKPYLGADSRFTVVGGETCFDSPSFTYNNCIATGGQAENEMKRLHFSYLNSDYNNEVNNDWDSDGCIGDIKKELGYRFILIDGTYTNEVQPGQTISLSIQLKNIGYTAPFNPRGIEVILQNQATQERWYTRLSEDPRFWFGQGATHSIQTDLCIPTNMPIGDYELFLNLPDPESSLSDRSEYAIRLANNLPNGTDVWEPTLGYNRLGHTISINSSAAQPTCTGAFGFIAQSAYSEQCSMQLDIQTVAIKSGIYSSESSLTASDAKVPVGEAVLFRSDMEVILGADFSVELGGEFEVKIAPCPPN